MGVDVGVGEVLGVGIGVALGVGEALGVRVGVGVGFGSSKRDARKARASAFTVVQ